MKEKENEIACGRNLGRNKLIESALYEGPTSSYVGPTLNARGFAERGRTYHVVHLPDS